MLSLNEKFTILFIGDSITDCGRSRENPEITGSGYPYQLSAQLGSDYAELDLRFLNLGISGNRAKDLKARWEKDCLSFKPDIVSILIGVNDVWRRYDKNDPTSTADFRSSYLSILQALQPLNCQIVMMEPFLLPVPQDRKAWREDLDPKITAVRELASEFADVYVPLDGIFASAACRHENKYWAPDGVHPSAQGHALIASSWREFAGI
ncbi:MAG: GDSL family lipase [Lentisphaerae bacterium GWF2_44_16]|nr:MAG: GDSL family lipase [Lentisphaerae bacterium GWF2_44_16]